MSIKLTNKLRPSFTLAFSSLVSFPLRPLSRSEAKRRRETSSFFFLLFLFLFQSHPDTTRRKLENIKCKVALDYAPHPSKRAFSRRIPFLLYPSQPPPPICPREIVRAIFANSLWTFILSYSPLILLFVGRGKRKGRKEE